VRNFALACVLVVAGCGGIAAPSSSSPVTGLYQLTEARSGDCVQQQPDATIDAYATGDPATTVGLYMSTPSFGPADAASAVFAPGSVFLAVPNGALTHDAVLCGGANDHTTITIESSSPDELHVRRVDAYSNVAGNLGSCPASALPAADCTLTTELVYTLRQPCPQSCIETGAPDPNDPSQAPTLTCGC
jgi:hypothetical protein